MRVPLKWSFFLFIAFSDFKREPAVLNLVDKAAKFDLGNSWWFEGEVQRSEIGGRERLQSRIPRSKTAIFFRGTNVTSTWFSEVSRPTWRLTVLLVEPILRHGIGKLRWLTLRTWPPHPTTNKLSYFHSLWHLHSEQVTGKSVTGKYN